MHKQQGKPWEPLLPDVQLTPRKKWTAVTLKKYTSLEKRNIYQVIQSDMLIPYVEVT